jgi:hypothetical protein
MHGPASEDGGDQAVVIRTFRFAVPEKRVPQV